MIKAIICAILSFIIPGLGQVIAGDLKKGIILFVLALIMGFLAAIVFKEWLVGIINLFATAKQFEIIIDLVIIISVMVLAFILTKVKPANE